MKLASPKATQSLQTTLRDGTIVARENDAGTSLAVFTVSGNPYSIAEVGQQLAWLAGTFTTSASSESVTFYTPSVISINRVSGGAIDDAWFLINWTESTMPTSGNGVCWLSMVRNPVVVTGYPIPRRHIEAQGLEMTPSIMTALIKSRRVVDFRGATFLKGFSSMLAVTKVVAEVVIWHHFFNQMVNTWLVLTQGSNSQSPGQLLVLALFRRVDILSAGANPSRPSLVSQFMYFRCSLSSFH